MQINESSSGRDVLKFALSTLHEAIDRETETLHIWSLPELSQPLESKDIAKALQRIYNSVKAIGIMYGITERELEQKK